MIIKYPKEGIRKMIKCRDKRTTITIDLPEECGYEGYSVDCSYSFDNNQKKYLVSMELFRDDISDKQSIDSQYINGDKTIIEHNIQQIIKYASMSGYFDKYIKKYEYTYKCFDKGNEFFEEKSSKQLCSVKECEIIRKAYYCSCCGAYVEETTKYCPHCNTELDWNSIEKEIRS